MEATALDHDTSQASRERLASLRSASSIRPRDINASSDSLSTLAPAGSISQSTLSKSQDPLSGGSLPGSIERPLPTASTSIRASISRTSVASVSALSVTTWASRLDTPGVSTALTASTGQAQAEEGHSHSYPPSTSGSGERQMRELPPVDTGFHAYKYLLAATLLETIIWGYVILSLY